MYRKTKGRVAAAVQINFEICGTEKIDKLTPNQVIQANFTRFSGENYKVLLNENDYRLNFSSSSKFCLAKNFKLMELVNPTYQIYAEYDKTEV